MIRHIMMTALEIVGTVSFSVSGALVAIGGGLDLFGVLFVGCITAVGGGIIRDLCLGNVPPSIFSHPQILLLALLSALAVFLISYRNAKRFPSLRTRMEQINNFFDAVGLAAFSVTGVEIAFVSGFGDHTLLSVLMGMITGVGGGMLRDILVGQTPYVLKKHIYALASILGSIVYFLIRAYTPLHVLGSFAAMLLVVIIRVMATVFHWKLPKIHLPE